MENLSIPEMESISINPEGVTTLLQKLEVNKAPGPDKILSRFLKTFALCITPPLVLIFKASLHQSHEWKHALIAPAFKKGDRKLPSNYRPISLTSISCKSWSTSSTHLLALIWRSINSFGKCSMVFRKRNPVKHNLFTLFMNLLWYLTKVEK